MSTVWSEQRRTLTINSGHSVVVSRQLLFSLEWQQWKDKWRALNLEISIIHWKSVSDLSDLPTIKILTTHNKIPIWSDCLMFYIFRTKLMQICWAHSTIMPPGWPRLPGSKLWLSDWAMSRVAGKLVLSTVGNISRGALSQHDLECLRCEHYDVIEFRSFERNSWVIRIKFHQTKDPVDLVKLKDLGFL